MKTITTIIPVYNEEKNIPKIFEQIKKIKSKISENYNLYILFANNDSTDDSLNILKNLSKNYSWVQIISYTRNFGYQRSIFEAIKQCNTDSAIIIDCDMQDPPSLIINFIEKWEKGYVNVYGIRKKRNEKWVFFRNLFYKIINKVSEFDIPINAGDFRLIDKIIINKIKKMDIDNPFVRGIIASVGYSSIGIEYTREGRVEGKSNAGFFKLLQLALHSITQYSSLPIRLLSISGIFLLIFLIIMISFLIVFRLFFGAGTDNFLPRGFTVTWILILGSIAINAIFLGLVGEYIASIHGQIIKSNKVHIKEKINFKENKSTNSQD